MGVVNAKFGCFSRREHALFNLLGKRILDIQMQYAYEKEKSLSGEQSYVKVENTTAISNFDCRYRLLLIQNRMTAWVCDATERAGKETSKVSTGLEHARTRLLPRRDQGTSL